MSSDGDGKRLGGDVKSPVAAAASHGGRERRAEEPTMRSVTLMSAPSVDADPHGGLQRSGFVVGPPPKGLGPPTLKAGKSEGLSVKKEWKGEVSLPPCWQVKTETLEMAPFPLERTHREIAGVEAEEVCSRISEALRLLSIEAEYDDIKAKAKCKTSDYTCFRIRLYAGSEKGQPVIVECQRRSGSGMSFMQSCRAILSAAEGKSIASGVAKKTVPPFMKCPVSNMKCLQGVKVQVDREAEVASALNKVMKLFRKDQHDLSVLAMENLCALTDPIKTFPDTALKASRTVVIGDDKHNIREEVAALLERDGVSSDLEYDGIGHDHPAQLRHQALLVLSNALALVSKDGSLERAVQQEQWFSEFLIPTLMDEVSSAKTSPNNASVATCCLNSLMSCSSIARGLVRDYDGVQVIGQAHEHGALYHELLANESKRCMNALDAAHQ